MKDNYVFIIVLLLAALLLTSTQLVAQTGEFKLPFQSSFQEGGSSLNETLPWLLAAMLILFLMYFFYRMMSS